MATNLDTFQLHINNSFSEEGIELINKFFISFSRIEHALKSNGFIHPNANPDWSAFIASIKNDFNQKSTNEISEAFDYIINNPPRIQRVENGNVVWIDRVFDNVSELNKISQHIRDIRNNLFHGSKFQGIYEPEVSRNYKLINSSLILLDYQISLNQDVLNTFLEPIPAGNII